jgi:hypothetical protein
MSSRASPRTEPAPKFEESISSALANEPIAPLSAVRVMLVPVTSAVSSLLASTIEALRRSG